MFGLNRRTIGIEVASVAIPLALVFVGRGLVASPPPVTINVQSAPPVITPVTGPSVEKLSPEQQKAADWILLLPPKYDLVSPLNHPTREIEAPKPAPDTPQTPVPVKVNPVEGLKLSGVLGNLDDQLAAINGKIYHLGDTVRPGLKLTEIDPRHSRIVLTDSEGKTYELKREQK